MTKSPKVQILDAAIRICMRHLGHDVPKKNELKARVVATEERMSKLWYGSDCTDFSFYSEPDYLYLALNSWTVRSMGDLDEVIRLNLHGDPKVVLDFHGGIGMSCIRLGMALPNAQCFSHSSVPLHREICTELAREFKLPNVKATEKVELWGGADLLLAQETFEHFRDPFAELRKLLDEVGPCRYLDGSSFGIDSPGHFPEYWDGHDKDGKPVVIPRKNRTRKRFNGILKERGFSPYWKRLGVKHPYNSHPFLWIKDDAMVADGEGKPA